MAQLAEKWLPTLKICSFNSHLSYFLFVQNNEIGDGNGPIWSKLIDYQVFNGNLKFYLKK